MEEDPSKETIILYLENKGMKVINSHEEYVANILFKNRILTLKGQAFEAHFFSRKGCRNWFKVVYFSVKGLIIKCINLYQFEGDYFGIWKVERSRCERIMET